MSDNIKIGLECYPNGKKLKDLLFRGNYISRKPVYDFYMKHLGSMCGTVLDLGCGNMPYKAIFMNAKEYIGMDVDTAREYGFKENGVVYYDGRDIPLKAESVDCVISAQVFEHIYDLDYSLGEIHRVLKKNGTLCFSVPMAYPIHYDPYDFRRFTHYGLRDRLERYGFKDIEITGSNRPIDSVRFIKIGNMPPVFRNIYTTYANIAFLRGRKKDRIGVRFENVIRRMLGKSMKKEDLMIFPLDYLVICKKGEMKNNVDG